MSERPHHLYSPSQLQFLEACPCYRPNNDINERAIAGTLAHAVTESRQDDARLSDEDSTAAAECLDFYDRRKQLMDEAQQRAPASQYPKLQVIELKEVYLPID